MPRNRTFALVAICSLFVASRTATAQADRLSLQGGAIYQRFTGNLKSQTDPGYGYEGQVRYSGYAWSLGIGVDYVEHQRTLTSFVGTPPAVVVSTADANFVGVFVEPRIGLGDRRRAIQPYFLIRAGYGRAKPKFDESGSGAITGESKVTALTWNGGVGVLMRLFGPVSADVGVSGGLAKWRGDGDSNGGALTFGSGTTTTGNVLARAGVSIALRR
jgi:hypothetical protein